MPDCIDNLLRTQDTPTAVVSRWIAAAGDPEYRDAFLTILKDPMTGHRDLINVKSRGAQGDATASRACDVCRYGVGCGFGVPIDLDPTILSTGLAGLTRFETSPTCAPRCCWLRLNSTSRPKIFSSSSVAFGDGDCRAGSQRAGSRPRPPKRGGGWLHGRG
jgi:hypothetical protein